MKIAAVVEFCPPRLGSDRRIYELLSRLKEKNAVHFVVFPPGRAFIGLIPFPLEHRADSDRILKSNVSAHYIGVPPFLQEEWNEFLSGFLLTMLFVFPKSLMKIRAIDPDLIVINYPSIYTGLFGFLISKLLAKKVVVEFNDLVAFYTMGLFQGKDSTKRPIRERLLAPIIQHLLTLTQNFIVQHAHLVTALTTYTVKYARSCGIRNDILLIPDGVDTTLFSSNRISRSETESIRHKYNLREMEKTVVYIGRQERWAGTELVLKCARRLKNQPVRFLLVGEGSLGKDTSIPNTIFCGRVSHEDVAEYLSLANVVLVPMRKDMLGQSASPLKLFEAMAMGKPVIASNTQGILDVIQHEKNGLALPFDEREWTEAIRRILDNPGFGTTLGDNARKTVECSYDWNVLVQKFEKAIYTLVKS